MGLVIVGGGPAGLAAARGYRAAGGDGAVMILTPELVVPYRRPPLSKEFLRGEVDDEELPIEDESWYINHAVQLRRGGEVATLDPVAKRIQLGDGETIGYDACVLATGAEPRVPDIPGATEEWVLLLRSLATARVLRSRAERARTALVVGCGFIGCEVAASLATKGVAVTLASREPAPHAHRLGDEAAERIQSWLEELGVTLRLGVEPGPLEGDAADLILLATGVTPRAGLAETAGIETRDGRIVVDEHMRTSADTVYAAGDVALAFNAAAGRHLAAEHWADALSQGEIAGRTIAGESARWGSPPVFYTTIGEHTLRFAGWGDGYDAAHPTEHGEGAWTIRYERRGTLVGLLSHRRDDEHRAAVASLQQSEVRHGHLQDAKGQ